MKKVLLLICSIFGAALLHGGVLFENGKSDWQIAIPVKPDAAEKYAATELQTFLKKISGAELPIVNSDDAKPKQIIIGSLDTSNAVKKNAAALKLKKSNTETIAVKKLDGALYLAGNMPRGALYAVYSFLQKQLGCRWFWPGDDGEFIIRQTSYTLPALDYNITPTFRFREMTPCGMHNHIPTEIWLARNFMNGGSRTPKVRDVAGFYRLDGQHWVSLNKKMFDTKPELFSLINGERSAAGYAGCWSNPEFFDYIVKKHLDIIKQKGFNMLNTFPADIVPRCECEKCTVIKDKSSRWYTFYAKLIEAIRKHHPEILFGGIAYQEYRAVPDAPVKYLEYVEYCQYNRCYIHKLGNKKCTINQKSMEGLRAWQTRAPMGIYGYEYDVFKGPMYLPFWNMIADEMKVFKEMKLVRMKTELGVNMKPSVPRIQQKQLAHRLANYVYARLIWNADEKIDDILNDFCFYLYGKAAPVMKSYHDTMAKAWDAMPHHLTYFGASPVGSAGYFINPKLIKFAKAQFKAALDAVKSEPDAALRKRQETEINFEAALFARWESEYNLANANAAVINLPLLKNSNDFSKLGSFKFVPKKDVKKQPQPAEMRAFYTKDALHIQITAFEKDMSKIVKGKAGKDISPWNDDMIEMFIDFNDGTMHRQMCVNLSGGTYDAIGMDGSWNADWSGKTTFGSDRWTMHITLPFKSFNVKPKAGDQWKLLIIRNSKSGAVGFPYPAHQDIGRAATVVFSGKSFPERRLSWVASSKLFGGKSFDKAQSSYIKNGWQFRKYTDAAGVAAADIADSKMIVIETYRNDLPDSFITDKVLPQVKNGAVLVFDSYFGLDKLPKYFNDPSFAVKFKENAGKIRKASWLAADSFAVKPNNLKKTITTTPSGNFIPAAPDKWIPLARQKTKKDGEMPFILVRPYGRGMVALIGDVRAKITVLENLLEYNKVIKR